MKYLDVLFFFFSSRRRHTRFDCDWSSDVCSSDLTAIGTAIATAANRLRRAPGKSKVIVLLTDGVNNPGTVDPRTAAQAAAALGIKIYVIGVGTRGEAPLPTRQGRERLPHHMMSDETDEPLST